MNEYMYVCTHTCACVCVHTYIYYYTYIYICIYIYVYIYVCKWGSQQLTMLPLPFIRLPVEEYFTRELWGGLSSGRRPTSAYGLSRSTPESFVIFLETDRPSKQADTSIHNTGVLTPSSCPTSTHKDCRLSQMNVNLQGTEDYDQNITTWHTQVSDSPTAVPVSRLQRLSHEKTHLPRSDNSTDSTTTKMEENQQFYQINGTQKIAACTHRAHKPHTQSHR